MVFRPNSPRAAPRQGPGRLRSPGSPHGERVCSIAYLHLSDSRTPLETDRGNIDLQRGTLSVVVYYGGMFLAPRKRLPGS
jgi:hypothetical protein